MSDSYGQCAPLPLRGLTVVVVGIYYAPDTTGIAPYTTDLCETLSRAGAEVTAVVGVPHYPQWRVSSQYRFRFHSHEVHGGVSIRRARHFVPRRQDVLRRGLYEFTFWLGSRLVSSSLKPDVVIGVTPSLAGASSARALARRHSVPLGLVVQDLVGLAAEQSGIRGGTTVSRSVARLEARILRDADRVAVISDAFVPLLLGAGLQADRIERLPNYVHVRSCPLPPGQARRLLGWPDVGRVALHSGNMGLKQDLHNVIGAARCALGRRDDIRFVLLGDGSTRSELRDQARGLPNVVFVDPLPADEYPVALAAADCLLLNERPSVVDMSLPSKLTSYLAAGRPVVAATHPSGATAAEVRRSRGGLVVAPGDPGALLAAVEQALDDARLAETLGKQGRRYAAHELSQASARTRIVELVASVSGGTEPYVERAERAQW